MFIKHGDGKIVNIIKDDQLTEEQKKSIKLSSVAEGQVDEDTHKEVEDDRGNN